MTPQLAALYLAVPGSPGSARGSSHAGPWTIALVVVVFVIAGGVMLYRKTRGK